MPENTEQGRGVPPVLLLSLPWTTLFEPSLGLCILKAVLAREGISARVLHLSMFLLEHVRPRTYHALSRFYALNDFLFSGVLDGEVTHAQQRLLRQAAQTLLNQKLLPAEWRGVEPTVERLLKLRNEIVPAWLNRWADEIAAGPASLIGMTCMFDQTIASVALAKLIKQRAPQKMIALGGYAVMSPAAEMLLRSNPWIDAVCAGEGEHTIVALARAAAGEIDLAAVPGIHYRARSGEVLTTQPPPPTNLDSNPTPDFYDFFADISSLSDEYKVDIQTPDLPIENSRGCWWGAKHHCVFCGIRDEDLVYRATSSEKVLERMDELHLKHGIDFFHFTDYILPHAYYETLLPELARRGRPYRLSGEMKANVSPARFALLADAGFIEVQPGIESFSSQTLRRMDKGVTSVQNVQTLMLGKRHGVRVLYNLLYGLPGEEAEPNEKMLAVMPRLVHLDPPVSSLPVKISRYAPLHMKAGGWTDAKLEHDAWYELVFSQQYRAQTGFTLGDYCYYFEPPCELPLHLRQIYGRIEELVNVWRELHVRDLAWLHAEPLEDGGLLVHDARGYAERQHTLSPECAALLLTCTQPMRLSQLRRSPPRGVPAEEFDSHLSTLDSLGLVFIDEDHAISLVLASVAPEPQPLVADKELFHVLTVD